MGGHAFISYVREDGDAVARLHRALEDAGIDVWRDVEDLVPGRLWWPEVEAAIEADELVFVLCLSAASQARPDSGQMEELHAAAAHHRTKPSARPWLIPVRLDDTAVPPIELGDGNRLDQLQWIDVAGDAWDVGCARLIVAIQAALYPRLPPAEAWRWLPQQAILTGAVRSRRWPTALPHSPGPRLPGHPGGVQAIAPVPVGERMLVATVGRGIARLWDPVTGEPVRDLPVDRYATIRGATAVPVDGQVLLATAGEGSHRLRLWDPIAGAAVGEAFGPDASLSSLCTVPAADGRVLLACGGDMIAPDITLWDPATGEPVGHPMTGSEDSVRGLAAVPIGDRALLAACAGRTVRLWDPQTGMPYEHGTWSRGIREDEGVYDVCALPVGDRMAVAAACSDGRVRVWDALAGWPVCEPMWGHQGVVLRVAAYPAGDRVLVASTGHDAVVRLWDPRTGSAVGRPLGRPLAGPADAPQGWVISLAAVPVGSGHVLASGSLGGTARLWEPAAPSPAAPAVPTVPDPVLDRWRDPGEAWHWPDVVPQRELAVLKGHTGAPLAMCSVPLPGGGVLVASSGRDHTVRFWDPTTGTPHGGGIEAHRGGVASLCTVPVGDRRLVASADHIFDPSGRAGRIQLWDPLPAVPVGHPIVIDSVSYLCVVDVGGEPLLAGGDRNGRVVVWDPTTGRARHKLMVGDGLSAMDAVPFEGSTALVTVDGDGTLALWDPATGREVGPRFGHRRFRRRRWPGPRRVHDVVAVAAGGGDENVVLATAEDHGGVILWSLTSGRPVGFMDAHPTAVTCLCPVPLGDRVLLATGGYDGLVRLWEPTSGTAVGAPLTGHRDSVWAMCCVPGPGATLLATGSYDDTVRLWGAGAPDEERPPDPERRREPGWRDQAADQEGRAHLRGDVVAWLAFYGRHKAYGDPRWQEVGETVAALHTVWSPKPDEFVRHLAEIALPAGGWPTYGAHRLIREIISDPALDQPRRALVEVAIPFARREGIGLVPWEIDLAHELGLLDKD